MSKDDRREFPFLQENEGQQVYYITHFRREIIQNKIFEQFSMGFVLLKKALLIVKKKCLNVIRSSNYYNFLFVYKAIAQILNDQK